MAIQPHPNRMPTNPTFRPNDSLIPRGPQNLIQRLYRERISQGRIWTNKGQAQNITRLHAVVILTKQGTHPLDGIAILAPDGAPSNPLFFRGWGTEANMEWVARDAEDELLGCVVNLGAYEAKTAEVGDVTGGLDYR